MLVFLPESKSQLCIKGEFSIRENADECFSTDDFSLPGLNLSSASILSVTASVEGSTWSLFFLFPPFAKGWTLVLKGEKRRGQTRRR